MQCSRVLLDTARPLLRAVASALFLLATIISSTASADDTLPSFVSQYCVECHGETDPEAALNLTDLPRDFEDSEHHRRWVKIHDRVASGEMPPRNAVQPEDTERATFLRTLADAIVDGERASRKKAPRLRRLTRSEYENTIRDLFDMPGIALANEFPEDGSAHGFNKHAEALDISHVNIAKYLEAADHILNYAIATRPEPPTIHRRRISLANRGGFVAHIIMNGDGVLLKNGLPDPEFPPAADQNHVDQGAHERWGSFRNGATVGLFRHEDESVSPYFIEHVTVYPARYRVRTSLWSFGWDKGQVLPGRRTEAARLSVVKLTGDGRGGQHPSYVLGYFDAPADQPQEHEVTVWLNHNELIGFNAASLAPVANYARKGRAMAFTGPGIAVDWLDVEGPLYPSWPPPSHTLLFDDLPLREFVPADQPEVRPPKRVRVRQLGAGQNRPDRVTGLWSVHSESPLVDADRLLASFLPRLFRRPVADVVRQQYVAIVRNRLDAGDSFEFAMRSAYRNALCSPDFLFHLETRDTDRPDDHALACRLSYLLWNSLPDNELLQHVAAGDLRQPSVLHGQIERMLADARSSRFVNDFLGQWLKLDDIAATDPDRKLYPEFSPYLQDVFVSETRAYFRELLDHNLDASHLVQSPFVMINQRLATHYGIDNVSGTAIRRVSLPDDCPRGGFLTQASLLKITANGTTTSPVPRGAFVLERILGEPPEPPPANIAAIEPDVRGATTIREQLQKHRGHEVCASCHRRIDPPGFALECFDVIGGYRNRYRSIDNGDKAQRERILKDPFLHLSFRLGPEVDATGVTRDGHEFTSVRDYQSYLASDSERLLTNLARQLTIYGTGRAIQFSDRAAIAAIVKHTQEHGGGLRTLLHEVIASPLFTGQLKRIATPAPLDAIQTAMSEVATRRLMMTSTLPALTKPARRTKPIPQPVAPTDPNFAFDDEHLIDVRVVGLFIPERVAVFRKLLDQFPEAQLKDVEYGTSAATIAYAPDSSLFRNAQPDQIIQRLSQRVRHLSTGMFDIQPPSRLPREALKRIEIPHRRTGLQGALTRRLLGPDPYRGRRTGHSQLFRWQSNRLGRSRPHQRGRHPSRTRTPPNHSY